MENFTSIPFKADRGMSKVNGVAKFSTAGIVLEYESKLFGLISDGVKDSRIAVSEILDVKFRKGLLKRGCKIEIRAKSLSKLNEMPSHEGKVTLKIESIDFDRAREAVQAIQKEMAQQTAETPPSRIPVSELFDGTDDETKDLN
jgi:hypothetical protein